MTLRRFTLVLAVVAAAAILATRFAPRVERVVVSGAEHYTPERIAQLADVGIGDPFLWVTGFRVRQLVQDPWIARVRVVRHWPATISIRVWEREPSLTDGVRSWATDGTELPGVPGAQRATLTQLRGWGRERTDEALELLRLLADHEIGVISYSPVGFIIDLADGVLMTPSPDALRDQWAAFESQPGKRIAVYPWGVSRLHE